jgi:hypothetical protein
MPRLFFILSSFIISYNYLDKFKKIDYLPFVWKRFCFVSLQLLFFSFPTLVENSNLCFLGNRYISEG